MNCSSVLWVFVALYLVYALLMLGLAVVELVRGKYFTHKGGRGEL